MGSRYEVEVTVISAKDLKNVNWRYGDLRPYAVLWVDPSAKCSTKVAVDGDTDPVWDEKLTVSLGDRRLDDAVLSVDVVHTNAEKDTKPLVGSVRVPLREVVDEAGIGGKALRTLKLKRPSGRPHGKLEVKIAVRQPSRYYDAPPPPGTGSYAPAYGQQSRDFGGGAAPPPYGYPTYGAPPSSGYPYAAPPPTSGYPYGAPAPPAPYGGQPSSYGGHPPSYGGQPPSYGGQPPYAAVEEKKKSKFGMGTGLAVGAAAGVLGGLALAGGAEYVENKIADDVAERVENDQGYDDGGFDDDY